MNSKVRRFKVKYTVDFAQNVWQYATLFWLLLAVATINKNVLFAAVTVHITEQHYLAFSLYGLDQLFGCINGRVKYFVWKSPSSVQVAPS